MSAGVSVPEASTNDENDILELSAIEITDPFSKSEIACAESAASKSEADDEVEEVTELVRTVLTGSNLQHEDEPSDSYDGSDDDGDAEAEGEADDEGEAEGEGAGVGHVGT